MAPLPDYVAGTITLTNNSTAFTGSGTGWLAAGFREGDTILGIEDNPGVVYVVESVTDNDSGTLTQPWDGPTGTYTYRMRYLSDGQRVTAQARQLIEMLGNGNLQAVAGLPGTPNTLMMFTGAGSLVEIPRTDLVSGVNYDVQVDDLAGRAAYDGADGGFAVLVSDTGDGRAAIYSKLSNAIGDWSAPAYVTGPSTDITVGSTSELPYGAPPEVSGTSGPGTLELEFSLPGGPALTVGTVTRGDADVTSTPVTGGYELDFSIPSQVAQGDYSGAAAYVTGDIVQDQGSSWVATQSTTGNAPPSLPTTSNAFWQLLARAGNDGAGTVTTLVAGDGIDIDSTDPTQPVVSVDPDIDADLSYRRGNILGSVSQSGGVPTGEIIERGSNANGQFVRFADGTQMCWAELTLSYSSASFCSEIWTYPTAFSMVPKPNGAVTDMSNATPNYASITAVAETPGAGTVSSTELRVNRIQGLTNFASGDTVGVSAFAIGRWF